MALPLMIGSVATLSTIAARWAYKHRNMSGAELWQEQELGHTDEIQAKHHILRGAADQENPHLAETSYEQGTATVHEMQENAALEYEYLSVRTSEVRLLQVHGADPPSALIECSLAHHRERPDLVYSALSYQWGEVNNQNPDYILVNNSRFKVTPSLYRALYQFRKRRPNQYLWVDRFSLNQVDHVEKSQQIPRMSLIYHRAAETISWLGPEDPDGSAEFLMDTLESVKTFRMKSTHVSKYSVDDVVRMWSESVGLRHGSLSNYRNLHSKLSRSRRWHRAFTALVSETADKDKEIRDLQRMFLESMRRMAIRGYWRRAWVLQEFTASRNIELWCGDGKLDLPEFITTVTELGRMGLSSIGSHEVYHLDLLATLKSDYNEDRPLHLLDALYHSYRTDCERKHDEIYSVIGISFNAMRFIPAVDYSLALHRVVKEMTEAYMTSTGSLDLICCRDRDHFNPMRLPSWAPDWRLSGRCTFNERFINYLVGHDEIPKPDIANKYWRATSGSRYTGRISFLDEDRTILVANGQYVGHIDVLTEATDAVGFGHDETAVRNYDEAQPDQYVDETPLEEIVNEEPAVDRALYEVMTIYKVKSPIDDKVPDWSAAFDFNSTEFRALTYSKPAVAEWLRTHESFQILDVPMGFWSRYIKNTDKTMKVQYHRLKRRLHNSWSEIAADQHHKAVLSAIVRILENGLRLMVVKGQKKYPILGWAHPEARKGDHIFLLEGCTVPVILRRAPNQARPMFEVIGDAYVHQAMLGELWKGYRRENLKEVYLH